MVMRMCMIVARMVVVIMLRVLMVVLMVVIMIVRVIVIIMLRVVVVLIVVVIMIVVVRMLFDLCMRVVVVMIMRVIMRVIGLGADDAEGQYKEDGQQILHGVSRLFSHLLLPLGAVDCSWSHASYARSSSLTSCTSRFHSCSSSSASKISSQVAR